MADPVELRMSVTSIKRVDPYVKDILATSTHVALYKFNPNTNEWERTETEGALFLYSRTGEPWHSIMIMNRLNTNNLIEPIVKEFDYQMQPPFLLYKNSKSKIFGIWFYDRGECITITYLLESLMESITQKLSDKSKRKQGGSDIFSMLSQAQQDFNNKTPTKSEIPVQPQFSSTPHSQDVPIPLPSQSVRDFFAQASNSKPVKNIAPPNQGANVLQQLMNNPLHTVEHIEKQQRSITPQESNQTRPLFFPTPSTGFLGHKDPELHNGINFLEGTSPRQHHGTSPLAAFLMQTHNLTLEEPEVSGTSHLVNLIETSHKPQLMPPKMFATSAKDKLDSEVDRNIPLLTSSQLAQALIYLLKNDTDFVTKVHDAYTQSVNEKLSNCSKPSSLI